MPIKWNENLHVTLMVVSSISASMYVCGGDNRKNVSPQKVTHILIDFRSTGVTSENQPSIKICSAFIVNGQKRTESKTCIFYLPFRPFRLSNHHQKCMSAERHKIKRHTHTRTK